MKVQYIGFATKRTKDGTHVLVHGTSSGLRPTSDEVNTWAHNILNNGAAYDGVFMFELYAWAGRPDVPISIFPVEETVRHPLTPHPGDENVRCKGEFCTYPTCECRGEQSIP